MPGTFTFDPGQRRGLLLVFNTDEPIKNVQYEEITVRNTVLKLQREVITIPDRENYHASGLARFSF